MKTLTICAHYECDTTVKSGWANYCAVCGQHYCPDHLNIQKDGRRQCETCRMCREAQDTEQKRGSSCERD